MNANTIVNVRETETIPADSYLKANVMNSWSPIPAKPIAINHSHDRRSFGNTNSPMKYSVIKDEITVVTENQNTTIANGVCFSFLSIIIPKAVEIAATIARMIPS
ncbi:hypothetical protein QR98_0096450 [Sarcoptes scabiei]|uniref:Uncharacterized protein n=1 Tax=Sarcoptes scabiei TaxID=52283 RepID=A0A132AJS9_SARSC|nr:hypothetical protein QR98_0096450 [Sarcoptes scabiei]